jgi:hypothetical protein
MAFVQFFWQIYISSVASSSQDDNNTKISSAEDEKLEKIFKEIG